MDCSLFFKRKKTRETLKQQMSDYWANKRQAWLDKSKESRDSISYDNDCLQQDANDHRNKSIYLMQYRDDNKTVCSLSAKAALCEDVRGW